MKEAGNSCLRAEMLTAHSAHLRLLPDHVGDARKLNVSENAEPSPPAYVIWTDACVVVTLLVAVLLVVRVALGVDSNLATLEARHQFDCAAT